MKLIVLVITLSCMNHSFAGGICSQNDVRPLQRHYSYSIALIRSVPESTPAWRIKREKEIRASVAIMALPKIFLLHERMNYAEYGPLDMNPEEVIIFRAAVDQRYDDNIDEINALVQDSIEKHRQKVYRLAVIQKNLDRRRRFAWNPDDISNFEALRPPPEPREEKSQP